ncbi:MAG: secondary thiamine-phosphate synthase enzyme YjbQ [Actinomycetota bacterium]|nr:secondary thiamine-phosphate synthase enzyme YjbQ [Actinomycetota bacterium]
MSSSRSPGTFPGTIVAARSLRRWARARLDFVDLTDDVIEVVRDSGIEEGFCLVYCAHTTCAVIINEWEKGALEDLRNRVEELAPADAYYAHDDERRRTQNLQKEERRNGHSHLAAMLLNGASQTIPVHEGTLLLGVWQRVFLFELDDPKERAVHIQVLGR